MHKYTLKLLCVHIHKYTLKLLCVHMHKYTLNLLCGHMHKYTLKLLCVHIHKYTLKLLYLDMHKYTLKLLYAYIHKYIFKLNSNCVQWYTHGSPALGRWRQGDQEYRINLIYLRVVGQPGLDVVVWFWVLLFWDEVRQSV